MKDTKHAYAKRYHGMGRHSPSMVFPFGVSFLFHLIIIGAMVFMPQFGSKPRLGSGVVNVSLVSLPSSGPDSAGPAASVEKQKPVEKKPPQKPAVKVPEPKPVPVVQKPPKAVSLAPKKIKSKKSLKKKTLDRSKMIDSALDRIEKKVEKRETDSVASAIEQLKRKIAASESQPQTGSGRAASGLAGPAGGSGIGGARVQESILIYQAEIQYQIQKNWAFSRQLAGDNIELEAVLAIKVLRNGEIEDIWFDKKSGNAYLDDSAYKALVKSNPLPPLPKDYMRPYYKVGLRFGPKGLKNE
ncbi:MAG: TonB C-terminal domain-containing protein [Desulfobacterales bacterium]|nr:TonB C-terminal domain-containing protein [Desulfobacterales bacterium]MDH4011715.1 TonB C-terminal domain-containing protein [Desulfobacterales bacterium]